MLKGKLTLATMALAGLGMVCSGAAYAEGTLIGGGRSGDSKWIDLVGVVQADQVWTSGRNSGELYSGAQHLFPGGSNLRRARLGVEGGLGDDFTFRLRTDLVKNDIVPGAATTPANNLLTSKVLDAFGHYRIMDDLCLTFGQFMLPMGMSNATDGDALLFMERSMAATAVRPDFRMGVMMKGKTDDYRATLALAVTQGRDKTLTSYRDGQTVIEHAEPTAYFGAATWSPQYDTVNVHVGASMLHQPFNTDLQSVTFRLSPEMTLRMPSMMATGKVFHDDNFGGQLYKTTLENVSTMDYGTADLALQKDSLTLHGEYSHIKAKRDQRYVVTGTAAREVTFRGYALEAAYILTGETRGYDYKTATFGRVMPRAKHGALEVGVRYSNLDLKQGLEGNQNGEARNYTLGLNYYVNSNVMFAVNYINAKMPKGGSATTPADREVDLVGLRGQFVF